VFEPCLLTHLCGEAVIESKTDVDAAEFSFCFIGEWMGGQ
jgi:hypothetical protein